MKGVSHNGAPSFFCLSPNLPLKRDRLSPKREGLLYQAIKHPLFSWEKGGGGMRSNPLKGDLKTTLH